MTNLMPAFEPVHPGNMLREDVLPALKLNVTAAATALGVTRQALHAIMRDNNPASVSPEMAVRLGKLAGNGPRLWINMQAAYDIWHAARRIDTSAIPTLAAAE